MYKTKRIALDGDGVIFDYRKAYPIVWKEAFGTDIEMVEPNAYHAHTAYGIKWESDSQQKDFFAAFGELAWATMPLMHRADEACRLLADAGFELTIVSSMNPAFGAARMMNCLKFNLPIKDVIAVKRTKGEGNPKLEALHKLQPEALADDLVDNFDGLDPNIHRAFINYMRFDCPSKDSPIKYDTSCDGLYGFARYWVSKM